MPAAGDSESCISGTVSEELPGAPQPCTAHSWIAHGKRLPFHSHLLNSCYFQSFSGRCVGLDSLPHTVLPAFKRELLADCALNRAAALPPAAGLPPVPTPEHWCAAASSLPSRQLPAAATCPESHSSPSVSTIQENSRNSVLYLDKREGDSQREKHSHGNFSPVNLYLSTALRAPAHCKPSTCLRALPNCSRQIWLRNNLEVKGSISHYQSIKSA